MAGIFVVVWEHWNGCDIAGGDMFMSLDEDAATEFMNKEAEEDKYVDYIWDYESEIWMAVVEHETYDDIHKLYIDWRQLDTRLT